MWMTEDIDSILGDILSVSLGDGNNAFISVLRSYCPFPDISCQWLNYLIIDTPRFVSTG